MACVGHQGDRERVNIVGHFLLLVTDQNIREVNTDHKLMVSKLPSL